MIIKAYHCKGSIISFHCPSVFFFAVKNDYHAVLISKNWTITGDDEARCPACSEKMAKFVKDFKGIKR